MAYTTPQAITPPMAIGMLGLGPVPAYPVAAMTTPIKAKLEPK